MPPKKAAFFEMNLFSESCQPAGVILGKCAPLQRVQLQQFLDVGRHQLVPLDFENAPAMLQQLELVKMANLNNGFKSIKMVSILMAEHLNNMVTHLLIHKMLT